MAHSLPTDHATFTVRQVPPMHSLSKPDQKVYISKIDRSLKSPHGTDVECLAALVVDVQTTADKILTPRKHFRIQPVAEELRRTPIELRRKTIPQCPAHAHYVGPCCLTGVASIFTHLVQFIFGRQKPIRRCCRGVRIRNTRRIICL